MNGLWSFVSKSQNEDVFSSLRNNEKSCSQIFHQLPVEVKLIKSPRMNGRIQE